jgi:molecular chaperone GrpE
MTPRERHRPSDLDTDGAAEQAPVPDAAEQEASALAAPPPADVELAQLQEKYLRLAAEFDNFRKRTTRERAELWTRAQGDLLARVVDALDDLSRLAHVDPATTDAKTLRDGAELAERKLLRALDAVGLRRLAETGVPFDPTHHEAVTMQPAASPAEDHTVGAVLQPGYLLGDLLVRPARVVVLTWQGAGPGGPPSATD